jgi:hypothetical protein
MICIKSEKSSMGPRNARRSSRHGLYEEDTSDDEGIVDFRTNSVASTARLNSSNHDQQPSPQTISGDEEFHFRYSSQVSDGTPFSPLYNLPNISPYPTPMIGKNENSIRPYSPDFHGPFYRPFYNSQGDDERNKNENEEREKLYSPTKDKLILKLSTTDFEMKVSLQPQNRKLVDSTYENPLDILSKRLQEINAKEERYNKENEMLIQRKSVMNSVEGIELG